MNNTLKNIIFLILSTVVGIILMLIIYRGFHFGVLRQFFSLPSHYIWITSVLLAGIAANILRSLRWRMLLESADIKVSRRRAIELVFISYLINSVTPRLGELTRSLLVKRGDAATSTKALGTVVIEKLADVGCLLVVVGLAIALRWEKTVWLAANLKQGLTLALPNYTFYIIIGAVICLLIGVSFPLRKYLHRFFSNLWQGICSIVHLRSPLSFAFLCLGIWACNFLQLYLLVPCFEALNINMGDSLHVFAAASIGMLFPTPAGAGPWHYAIVKTLTKIYFVSKPIAQSFALITHGLKTILVMLLGCLGYLSYYRSVWKSFKRKG